jgi:hypothetical protein
MIANGAAGSSMVDSTRLRLTGSRLAMPSLRSLAALVLPGVLYTRISDLPPLDGLPVSLTQVLVACALVGIALDARFARRSRLEWHSLLTWLLVYAVAMVPSALFASERLAPAAALVAYLRDVLIVWIVLTIIRTPSQLRLVMWSLLAGAALLVFAAVVQLVSGFDLGGLSSLGIEISATDMSIRLDGPVRIDSNVFAQLLVIVVPLGLSLAWSSSRRAIAGLALGAVALTCVTAIWTFSRGGFVGLVVVLAGATLLQHRSRVRVASIGLVLLVVLLGAPGMFWQRLGFAVGNLATVATGHTPALDAPRSPPPTGLQDQPGQSANSVMAAAIATLRITGTGRGRMDDSVFDRSSLARVGVQIAIDHPITGVGKGNYLAAYPRYAQRIDPSLPDIPLGPHDMLIQIAAETGVLGLAAFIGLICAAVICVCRTRAKLDARERLLLEGIGLAMMGFVVTGVFLNDTIYDRSLWLLIALVAGAGRLAASRDHAAH